MKRRTRIKAVANLSSVRRVANKTHSDNQKESENVKKDSPQIDDIESNSQTNAEPGNIEVAASNKQLENVTSSTKFDKPNEIELNSQITKEFSASTSSKNTENQTKKEYFKKPANLPRSCQENEVFAFAEFRKPKIAPRLNIPRSVSKPQENESKNSDKIENIPSQNTVPVQNKKQSESPINMFSPPRIPQAEADSQEIIINQNVHKPSTPQSPFRPIPYPRIRTESKNLQPRKKVRTEDEKTSTNPTDNQMKPRTMTKEKSPKKIYLTAEHPLPSTAQKESAAIPAIQLKLNTNGELVLDEASLVVENKEQEKNRILLANTNVVYHDELSGTHGFYKRQQRTKEWPQEKFKREEKTNPHLVNKALLNHNTFDIGEPQRELDQEDEIKKKELAGKSSEAKELVKRKILKKQELKRKAHQPDKSKIGKILSHGDLVLDTVNNNIAQGVEENAPRKRNRKRYSVQSEPHMEVNNIILRSKFNTSNSVNKLKSPKNNNESLETTSTEMKSPAVVCRITHGNNLVPFGSTSYQKSSGDRCTWVITKSERDSDQDVKKKISSEYLTESESGCSITNVKKEGPKQKSAILEVSHDLTAQTSKTDFEHIVSPNGGESKIKCYRQTFECTDDYRVIDMDLEPSYEKSLNESSLCAELIDDENFLNSLDLEKLVIVITQVDGKDIYDIHETTDADSQNISEKPLNLPRFIVDLIVSAMTQDD